MRRTFKVGNDGAKQLHRSVAEVFRFRDWAVHPPADFREPIPHDMLDSSVEWRFVAFRAENACRAVGAVTSIIAQCVHEPRRQNADLVAWCEGQEARIDARLHRVLAEIPTGGGEAAGP